MPSASLSPPRLVGAMVDGFETRPAVPRRHRHYSRQVGRRRAAPTPWESDAVVVVSATPPEGRGTRASTRGSTSASRGCSGRGARTRWRPRRARRRSACRRNERLRSYTHTIRKNELKNAFPFRGGSKALTGGRRGPAVPAAVFSSPSSSLRTLAVTLCATPDTTVSTNRLAAGVWSASVRGWSAAGSKPLLEETSSSRGAPACGAPSCAPPPPGSPP